MHDTYEKDCTLQANLCKAPRLNLKVLHPGNNKQSVPLALAIVHETTTAAIESYFPEKNNCVDFLRLLNIWWIISNSKTQFLPNKHRFQIGIAAKIGRNKSEFLRSFAALIEELLDEQYRYILTSRFQSDSAERRFGQYRQMSGGRILVGLRDVTHSEKNMKLKSLLKGNINDLTEDIFIKKDEEEKL